MPQDTPRLGNPPPAQGARAEFDAMLHQSLQAHMQRLLTTQARLPAGDRADLPQYALVSAGQCRRWSAADMVATHTLEHERLFIQTPEADMAEIGPWLIELPNWVKDNELDWSDPWMFPLNIGVLRIPAGAAGAYHLQDFMERPAGELGEVPDWNFLAVTYKDKGYVAANEAIKPNRAPR